MATANKIGSLGSIRAGERTKALPADSLGFDYLYAVLTGFFALGFYLDGWAHNHGKVDNSFFTPWHGVLYGSVFLLTAVLAVTHFLNVRKGHSPLRALPQGYTLSYLGAFVFFIGGALDFGWHSLFGFEANLETLISPAHLLLATSAFLFITGPLRAVWHRGSVSSNAGGNAKGWAGLFPAIISLTVLLSLSTFFTQFAHFIGNPAFITGTTVPKDSFLYDLSGVVSVMIGAALTIGIVLFALRRWQLPFGTLTFMFTVNFALMCWMRYRDLPYMNLLVVGAFIAGLVSDLLLVWLKPSPTNPIALRIFAAAVPAVLSLIYFLVLIGTTGIWWKVHMWLGSVFYAAIIGVFLSYLMVPPAIPIQDAE